VALVIDMRQREFWDSRRGTSLVEVLVVMVVLLVGIMTVVQMFPTGFNVLKASESQTIATRLAQQELERWKGMVANLPDGIVPINESGAVLNDQDPGPPFEGYVKDSNGAYERKNALNVRQILGETTPIPMASRFQTSKGSQFGSRYTLGFGPIDLKPDHSNLSIRSGDLSRIRADSDSPPPAMRAGQYAIDYELTDGQDFPNSLVFHVAFPRASGPDRKYYISYSYEVDNGTDDEPELYSAVSQAVYRKSNEATKTVAADDDEWIEVPIDASALPSGSEVVGVPRYSDSCARGFVEKNPDDDWLSPYEFYIADATLGIIAFNPAGHDLFEYTARGVQPIIARIDYQIYDLRIIREERVIPQPNPDHTIPVKMSLRFILDAGDPVDQHDGDPTDNPNEDTFEGLVATSVGRSLSVIVIDLATGLRVNDKSITRASALDKLPMVNVDYKAGIVKLPETADLMDGSGEVVMGDTPLAGRHLRFYYRADGDWSVQCTKAYSSYTRNYGGASVKPSFREFKFNYNTNRLTFAKCELGKTVLVDYTYIDENNVEHKVNGEAHKIDMDTASADGDICVDLKLPNDKCAIVSGSRIVVVGASFTARVIWRDKTRWRNVDMDTYLTRK
jgi:type II secretory pathway pseudopilin PulG/PAS domain-containing protein